MIITIMFLPRFGPYSLLNIPQDGSHYSPYIIDSEGPS